MNGENLVVKANKLIEAKGRMTVLEQKLVIGLISKITPDDKAFSEYVLSVSKLRKDLQIKDSNVYNILKETANNLMKKEIVIEEITESGKRKFIVTRFISSAIYVEGEGSLKLYFDPVLKPYLLDLKEKFTQYQLKNILNLKGSHAIRIYELLKQYEKIRKRKFEVYNLKELLGVEEGYERFYDFEKYVLIPAKTEINEKTDIVINYEKIRKGRRIGEIKFTIEPKEVDEDQALMDALSSDKERMAIRVKCGFENEKFNDKQVMQLYEIAFKISDRFNIDPYAYIKLNHEYMQRQSNVKSRFAYLKKAIGEDFAGAVVKIVMGEQK